VGEVDAREIAGATWLGACPHVEGVGGITPEAEDVCPACVAAGDPWVHLRTCLSCGAVGCCDSSPNRHATGHHLDTGHPLAASLEPADSWAWCYVDEVLLVAQDA
jgi:uncharacterized UBP type Zn finger protein